mgnify:CR=1 FL=1
MSRCLYFKQVTQLGHFREYSRITQLFTHTLLGNSSDPGVLRDNSSVASVNGINETQGPKLNNLNSKETYLIFNPFNSNSL